LRSAIGPSLFARITKIALDTERWKAAKKNELITKTVIEKCEIEEPTKPWIEVKG